MKKLFFLLFLTLSVLTATPQDRRYVNITTMGILAGTSSDRHPAPLSIITELHDQFRKNMSAGFMTGIEQLNENTLPVGISYRIFDPSGGFRLFAGVYAGYSISLEKFAIEGIIKSQGGVLAGGETGAIIRLNDCHSLFIGLGYRYSELSYKVEDPWLGEIRRVFTFNRFSVRFGIAL